MITQWFMARVMTTRRGSVRCGIAHPLHGAMVGTIAGCLGGAGVSGSGLVVVMPMAVFGIHPDRAGDLTGAGTITIGTEAGAGDMTSGPERPAAFTTTTVSAPGQVHSATMNGPMDTVMLTTPAPANRRGYKMLSMILGCRCTGLVWEGIGLLPQPIKESWCRRATDSSGTRNR